LKNLRCSSADDLFALLDHLREGQEAPGPRGQRSQGLPRRHRLTLKSKSDATAAVVGSSTADEKMPPKHHRKNAKVEDLAAQRAVNTKDYLVTEAALMLRASLSTPVRATAEG